MKSKIKQLKNLVCSALILVISSLPCTNAKAQNESALSPALQGLATGGSTPNWIDFREDTKVNPTTIFSDLKEAFGLSGNDQMNLLNTETDNMGFKHYRYQQYFKNRKVVYGEFAVHQTPDGFVRTANGRLIKGLNIGSEPKISEQQALANALKFMNASKYLWENKEMENELKRQEKNEKATYYPKGELVYAPNNNDATYRSVDYKLTWNFKIYTDDNTVTAKTVYVDAISGQIIQHADIAMKCSGGTGTSAFNGSVSVSTQLSGGSYRSLNDCQTTQIRVYNCNGGGAANNYYTDADNTWTNASAVQAMWGAAQTYSYYNVQHNRQSWNGANGDMIAYNNSNAPGLGVNNACWGCTGNSTIYGMGSTSAATDDWNTNDIMGHEFTHGVTQASANLTYSGESGALNESFSDIFGEMVESFSEGNCDYLVGADRGAIRSFINPKSFSDYAGVMPDTYLGTGWYTGTADNSGVHHNSSVQNHWFYLLSEGGSGTNDLGKSYNVTGITRFKARLIAYRALTTYLNSSSKYIDARAATLRAAFDLYGQCSAEIIAVGDAWSAVGVESQSAQYTNNACGTYSNGQFVQAISQLNSGGSGCTTVVNSATNIVYFTARDRVILNPGFTATAGSRFVAYLEPCSSTMWKGGNNDGGVMMSDAERGIKTPVVAYQKQTPVAEAQPSQDEISISPNPFRSNFNVTINAKEDTKGRIALISSLGVKMQEKAGINFSKGSNRITFDGSNLPGGMYMVEIMVGDLKTVRKIMKL